MPPPFITPHPALEEAEELYRTKRLEKEEREARVKKPDSKRYIKIKVSLVLFIVNDVYVTVVYNVQCIVYTMMLLVCPAPSLPPTMLLVYLAPYLPPCCYCTPPTPSHHAVSVPRPHSLAGQQVLGPSSSSEGDLSLLSPLSMYQ